MIFVFWRLSFKPAFSLSSLTFIKMLFSSSLSAIRVLSSAYQRLLIFLLGILIPACASSSQEFWMMCSAYKLNKQSDNIKHWHTSFPIWNQSIVPCPVLPVASLPACKFLRRQVRLSGNPPGSSVPGILQAIILKLVASSFSRSSWHRVQTWLFHFAGSFYHRSHQGSPNGCYAPG